VQLLQDEVQKPTARLRRERSAIGRQLSAFGCWLLAVGFAASRQVERAKKSQWAKILMFSNTARLLRKRSTNGRQLSAFGCWRFGCGLCGLMPGGARKTVAAYKDFDVW
jgi:hypothetical protein